MKEHKLEVSTVETCLFVTVRHRGKNKLFYDGLLAGSDRVEVEEFMNHFLEPFRSEKVI